MDLVGLPAVGNGSLTGYYMQAGKLIHARIRLLIGRRPPSRPASTRSRCPPRPLPCSTRAWGQRTWRRPAGNHYPGIAYRPGTPSACSLVFGTARWSASAPVAPAQNDVIAVNLSHEAA